MITDKHSNTKRQRRAKFVQSCLEFSIRQVGLSLRKRAARRMARMPVSKLAELEASASNPA